MKRYYAVKENGREFLAFRFGKILFMVDGQNCVGYSGFWWPRNRVKELRSFCKI